MSQVTPRSRLPSNNAHHLLVASSASILDVENSFDQGHLIRRFTPIPDSSHSRDRLRSSSNLGCFPGTRKQPISEVTAWADSGNSGMVQEADLNRLTQDSMRNEVPHIYWLCGSKGSGKSSISVEVAKIYAGSGRLLASYFFFREAGDRRTLERFAVTLANQLAVSLPATAPSIEIALRAMETTAKRKQAFVGADHTTGPVSLAKQLDRLVLSPLQSVIDKGVLGNTSVQRPYLIIVDGIDECEDKQGVASVIDHILAFFTTHPSIPLRILITSRKGHFGQRLRTNGVVLGDLDSHSPRNDIQKVLEASFQAAAIQKTDVRKYVRVNGHWLLVAKSEVNNLVEHIGESFQLASTVFKLICQSTRQSPLAPTDSLPLFSTVDGLDGLYTEILTRSQHLPHFRDIVSTIARLMEPVSIVGIADLLGKVQPAQVGCVLLNTQAIVHIPGTDVAGEVTLCHTSFRVFLTTAIRSESFFVPRWFHLHLSYYCFVSNFERRYGKAYTYGLEFLYDHLLATSDLEGCSLLNEVEQANAHPTSSVERLPFHAFLCSMYFYSIAWGGSRFSDRSEDILMECAQQLALAAEWPDGRARLWLENELVDGPMGKSTRTIKFTQETCKTLQQYLWRASASLRAKFPGLLNPQFRPIGVEQEHKIGVYQFSGINIYKVLAWTVARAHIKWEEAKITAHHPLELSIFYNKLRTKIVFSFDEPSGGDESD